MSAESLVGLLFFGLVAYGIYHFVTKVSGSRKNKGSNPTGKGRDTEVK